MDILTVACVAFLFSVAFSFVAATACMIVATLRR